jgi:hypothetical protein
MSDLLIFGLKTDIREPFSVGDLIVHPIYDLHGYLKGYDPGDVEFIIDSEAKYAQYRPNLDSQPRFLSPLLTDHCLIPLRLLKSGWLSAITVMPITKSAGIEVSSELGSLNEIFGQIWAEPMHYELREDELPLIRRIHDDLMAVPKGYLELALRRFSRSYQYYCHSEYAGTSELDDCIVDLVIALESITSQSEAGIMQHIASRTILLLGSHLDEDGRKNMERKVRRFYKHRSSIVHGEDRDEISEADYKDRFSTAEDLRTLVRDVLNACIRLLTNPGLSLRKASGKPKKMADIIDSEYGLSSP